MSLRNNVDEVILCYVTDRYSLGEDDGQSLSRLIAKISELAEAGVDWIQLREKDLSGSACSQLARTAIDIVGKRRLGQRATRIIVNDRLDVALTEGAAGVHLGERSLPMRAARRLAPSEFLVGSSAHSVQRAKIAAAEGADYLIFGPVFATPSKASFGEPQGLGRLAEICRAVSVPVLAIGGVSLENAASCRDAGAAGIAGIRLFQEAPGVHEAVASLRLVLSQQAH